MRSRFEVSRGRRVICSCRSINAGMPIQSGCSGPHVPPFYLNPYRRVPIPNEASSDSEIASFFHYSLGNLFHLIISLVLDAYVCICIFHMSCTYQKDFATIPIAVWIILSFMLDFPIAVLGLSGSPISTAIALQVLHRNRSIIRCQLLFSGFFSSLVHSIYRTVYQSISVCTGLGLVDWTLLNIIITCYSASSLVLLLCYIRCSLHCFPVYLWE